MRRGTKLLLLGGGVGAVVLLASSRRGGGSIEPVIAHFAQPQQGAPPPPPPKPQGGTGQTLGDSQGRAWMMVPINRNGKRKRELAVARIADFGEGIIIADVYEQIEPPDDVFWPEATACGVSRYALEFRDGKLVSIEQIYGVNGEGPACVAGARPISQAYLRSVEWVQRGPELVLKVETLSGMIKYGSDAFRLYKDQDGCVTGGQCDKWDNDYVESGSVLFDVLWKAEG
jgi:hypothetical protein